MSGPPRLWTRAGAIAVALVVPLVLALASQSLAARPGRPAVTETPVVLPAGDPAPSADEVSRGDG